jgi:hypothetical protein
MLFLIGAACMLAGLPVLTGAVNLPTPASVVGILILVLAAGMTNPLQRWDAVVNLFIAITGFVIFETYAVNAYTDGTNIQFFLTNLFLSFVFLFASYFSIKTVRGLFLSG